MGKLTISTPGRTRPRRLRRTQALRDLVAETRITPAQFIVPRFVLPADKGDEPIPSLPGLSQLGIEKIAAGFVNASWDCGEQGKTQPVVWVRDDDMWELVPLPTNGRIGGSVSSLNAESYDNGYSDSSTGSGTSIPGTSGIFPARNPRFAKYMHVGVFDVRDTPIKTISASLKLSRLCPSS